MSKSVSLNVNLHHSEHGFVADITHPATGRVVQCTSLAHLVREIHEYGDTLRPVVSGQWESLLAAARNTSGAEEMSLSA